MLIRCNYVTVTVTVVKQTTAVGLPGQSGATVQQRAELEINYDVDNKSNQKAVEKRALQETSKSPKPASYFSARVRRWRVRAFEKQTLFGVQDCLF